MDVTIALETHNKCAFEISNCEKEGMCIIDIEHDDKHVHAIVSIEELKLALRKLTTK
jgi:hypothetical protein